jgi:hypothetical protein
MGINRDFHYGLESQKAWHRVGDRLAPKQEWAEVLTEPGLINLMIQGERPDNLEGYLQVRVQPSTRVDLGVYVHVNDHYQLPSPSTTPTGAPGIIDILTENWNESLRRGSEIAQRIADLGELE